jgi:type IV secretory pathway ATPase VirB11/archaellum biosynthesis ATPase
MSLDLRALVLNRTLSPEMAATLAATARQRRSFLTVAIPRLAGKSTLMAAILDHRPEGAPVHVLERHPRDLDALEGAPGEGYLVVPEVSPYPAAAGYIWGADVRRVFATLERGFALATALHAGSLEEAFEVLHEGCGVPDEDLARLELMVYIRSIGPWQRPSRRVVAEVHEILGVSGGVPAARLLGRWDEASDTFEVVERSERLGTAIDLEALAADFGEAAPPRT